MPCNSPMVEYSSCKFDPPRLFKIQTRPRPYYWRCECSYLEYAKRIKWKTGLVLLAQILSASPIRRDNAYLQSCSNRKQKKWVVQRIGTFKLETTLDRHNARPQPNNCMSPSRPPLIFRYHLPLNHGTGGMVFYQVFLLSFLQCTVTGL